MVGRPLGLAQSLPGFPEHPTAEQTNAVLAHLRRSAMGRSQTAPAVSQMVPYCIIPLPPDAQARQRSSQLQPRMQRPLAEPLPAPASAPAGRALQQLNAGRHGSAPFHAQRSRAAVATPSRPSAVPQRLLVARGAAEQTGQQPRLRTLGPAGGGGGGAPDAPGMYSQPAVAMRSLLTSASQIFGRVPPVDAAMPTLAPMPFCSLQQPPALPSQSIINSMDIQRAAESVLPNSSTAAFATHPLQPDLPFNSSHGAAAPSEHGGMYQQQQQRAAEASLESRYPTIMPLGPPPENPRYPKIHFSAATQPLAFAVQPPYIAPLPLLAPKVHANGSALPPMSSAHDSVAASSTIQQHSVGESQPQLHPPPSRLVAVLSQSLDFAGSRGAQLPAAAAQLPPPQQP